MNNLNFYSLLKDKFSEQLRFIPNKKLFNLKDSVYQFIFISKKRIITKNKDPFFYRKNRICKSLQSFTLSYVTKKKNKIFILCDLGEKRIENIIFKNCEFLNIRETLFNLQRDKASIVSACYSLYSWQVNNKYCGKCGSKTRLSDNGNSLVCSKKNCYKKSFPSVYPTVIVNIVHKEKILLARNIEWNKNLYSCLAGFCEQNETAEEALRREVYEEVGLELKRIKYRYSQYWPLNSNLMLGFEATALSNEIKLNKSELEKAKWFSAKEVIDLEKAGKLILPRKEAIAYSLINDWLKKN